MSAKQRPGWPCLLMDSLDWPEKNRLGKRYLVLASCQVLMASNWPFTKEVKICQYDRSIKRQMTDNA